MNTRVNFCALLQGIFLTQGSNLCLLMPPALAGRFFTTSTTWEAPLPPYQGQKWTGGVAVMGQKRLSIELCWVNGLIAPALLPIMHNYRDSEGKLIEK